MSFAIAVHLQLYDLFPTAMPSRIEDYALIGDCQSAALVGRDGSIDWLCVRRFDSSACFAALLGTPENGRWRIAPVGEVRRVGRRYRKGTLVLETEFETAGGVVLVVDCMPLHGDRADVVRLVVGKRGRVAMEMDLVIRFDYGWLVPWVRRQDHGIVAVGGPDILRLRSEVELRGEGFRTVSEFEVGEGESRAFVLTWCPSHVAEPAPVDARAAGGRDREVVAGMVERVLLPRRMGRGGAAVWGCADDEYGLAVDDDPIFDHRALPGCGRRALEDPPKSDTPPSTAGYQAAYHVIVGNQTVSSGHPA